MYHNKEQFLRDFLGKMKNHEYTFRTMLDEFNKKVTTQCPYYNTEPDESEQEIFANFHCLHPKNHPDGGDGHCSYATCPFRPRRSNE